MFSCFHIEGEHFLLECNCSKNLLSFLCMYLLLASVLEFKLLTINYMHLHLLEMLHVVYLKYFLFLSFLSPSSFGGIVGKFSVAYLNELAHCYPLKFSVMELVMGSLRNMVSLRMLRFPFLFPVIYIKQSCSQFCKPLLR